MKSLLAMFGGGSGVAGKKAPQDEFITQKTIVEEGNVAPGKAFRKSKAEKAAAAAN